MLGWSNNSVRVPLSAHAWTIGPNLVQRALRRIAPAAEPWTTAVDDPQVGRLTLRGELRREPGANACVVVVHGLGGSIDRHYCISAALAAQRVGLSCLRFGLRGADRSGEDFYHAGLTADIEAAVASEALRDFTRLYVLGYSLGGHVTLRYALTRLDPRVRAVAAVCAPLDLELGARQIDRVRSYVYRKHVLGGLNEIYTAVARKHSVPTPTAQVLRARSMREWDGLTVVPRYGFGSAAHYYASMSVGPRLHELQVPSLLVQSTLDPMVPPWTYEPHLQRPLPRLEIQRLSLGGHVAFPRLRPLGLVGEDQSGAATPLADQILRWFATRDRS
jgi:predicted alpha/beta-fold hydrolase